jgi:pimeloyl-ACP methyl ester carboxylesterase/predicted glycosyltransferase
MRARLPDTEGVVRHDGVEIGYEVYGDGAPTFLLLPTWTIVHSRFWKAQVPYLARHHRVVVFDGPGNGRSGRPLDPDPYRPDAVAAAAIAVMDATNTDRAVLASLSKGANWSLKLAADHPGRVLGQVFIGPTVPLTPTTGARARVAETFHQKLDDPQGWEKYNAHHWLTQYEDFAEFFFAQCFSETHSTKQREDAVGWALETSPEVLLADMRAEYPDRDTVLLWCGQVDTPVLVIHGADDRISPLSRGEALAEATGGELVVLEGSGHIPLAREPVKVNRAITAFADRVAGAPARSAVWTRGLERAKKVLYLSSPIGLGHARRDLAIAEELRTRHPDVDIHWLAQHPVTTALEAKGETIHPASEWLVSESAHIASESSGHDLRCFQALRRMDEILVANFMVFQEVVDEGLYDLVVSDEAWDVDHFWHENPELKRGSHVWMTDFVGYLPMADGDGREPYLTADYNAEMIEHIDRFPRIRDRAIFVGNGDDIVPDVFGPGLPKIRDWTQAHFDFSGYITGFAPPTPDQVAEWRADLGYREDEKICIVTVGGSGVGRDLLEKAIAAYPIVKDTIPELRMIAVAGPRIDPGSLPSHPGLEVRGYVDRLYRHLCVCDLAVVQGGLTTTMELTAARRPFLYFPLRNHFEQNRHVRYRLDQYAAGRCMDYAETDPDALAAAIAAEIGRRVDYRAVETNGAARAAAMIADLL